MSPAGLRHASDGPEPAAELVRVVDGTVMPSADALRDAARAGDFEAARERAHELMVAANAVQAFCLPAPPAA